MANGHITEREQALGFIDDADDEQIAELAIATLERLGHHGRSAAEKLLALISKTGPSALVEEGLAQIESVEGVISGRTDSL